MNKRQMQIQALILAGILSTTPLSFADAKPQAVKATAITQAAKVEMKFTITGTVGGVSKDVLTVKTDDNFTYTVNLNKLNQLGEFKELALKAGAKIKVNCDLSQANLKIGNVESVSISKIGPSTNSKDVTLAVATIPAEAIKGGVVSEVKPVTTDVTKIVKINEVMPLEFAVSLEIGGKVFKFNE